MVLQKQVNDLSGPMIVLQILISIQASSIHVYENKVMLVNAVLFLNHQDNSVFKFTIKNGDENKDLDFLFWKGQFCKGEQGETRFQFGNI